MDIACYVVDVVAVDYYLAAAGGCEQLRQAAARGVERHGHYLVARNHAVAHVCGTEVEGVLKEFDFVFHGGLRLLHCVYGFFKIVVEVAHAYEAHVAAMGVRAHKAHEHARKERGNERHRI